MVKTIIKRRISTTSWTPLYLISEFSFRILLICVLLWLKKLDTVIVPVYGLEWNNYFYKYQQNEKFAPIKFTCTIGVAVWTTVLVTYSLLYFFKRVPKLLILQDFVNLFLGATLAVLFSDIMVHSLKTQVGRLRPDFLSRCFGESERDNWLSKISTQGIPKCDNPNISSLELLDGRQSFPSSHAAIAVSLLLYIGLFVYRKLSQIKNTGSLRLAVPALCAILATIVMASRVTDNRHHPTDVIAGGIIGLVFSVISFRFYDSILHADYEAFRANYSVTNNVDPFNLSTPAQYAQGLNEGSTDKFDLEMANKI